MLKITNCEDCPFRNFDSEWGMSCNHLTSPKDNYLENVKEKYDDYPFGVLEIPDWCPLKNLKKIFIGVDVDIEFDERLFSNS